jgi:hypothetical protein
MSYMDGNICAQHSNLNLKKGVEISKNYQQEDFKESLRYLNSERHSERDVGLVKLREDAIRRIEETRRLENSGE